MCTCSGAATWVVKSYMCPWVYAYVPCKKWGWISNTTALWLSGKRQHTCFVILVNPEVVKIHEIWHAIMERHQHAVEQILSHLGQAWVYSSHKPELLTTSMMVFPRERPTFGDETISIASYFFQKISRVNIEQHECCVKFWNFSWFIWTFLYIN